VAVGIEYQVAAGEGGDQQDEGGAGQVEVGQEAVDRLESIAGQDVEVGRAVSGLEAAVCGDLVFQRAGSRRADGEDPALLGARPVQSFGRLGRDFVALGLEGVVSRVGRSDRGEGPDADVEGQFDDLDAALAEGPKDVARKVESGRGRSDGGPAAF
jgi:hypothetical protein